MQRDNGRMPRPPVPRLGGGSAAEVLADRLGHEVPKSARPRLCGTRGRVGGGRGDMHEEHHERFVGDSHLVRLRVPTPGRRFVGSREARARIIS